MDAPVVWVISSDPDTRRLIGLNLSRRGFRILEASRQDELPASVVPPQLIILDVDLSDEPDWEAAGALRQNPWARGIPLILLLAAVPRVRQLAPFQPVRWVQKPLAMDVLLALVRQSLGR